MDELTFKRTQWSDKLPQPTLDQAKHYVDKCPEAVEDNGGDEQTFKIGCALFRKFPFHIASEAFEYYNETKCKPKWEGKEWNHKVERCSTASGYVSPSLAQKSIAPVPTSKIIVSKTHPFPKPLPNAAITHLQTCFADGEQINISIHDKDKKPTQGGTEARDILISSAERNSGSLYPDFSSPSAKDELGMYICINPLMGKERKANNVSDYRHLLVEFDKGTKQQQWDTIVESQLPVAVVVDSGGRSLHAWVKVNAKNQEEYTERQRTIYAALADYDLDKNNIDPCRYSRLAGQKRGDKIQDLLAVNIGCESYEEWLSNIKFKDLPSLVDVMTFEIKPITHPDNLIGNWFFERQAIIALVGATGSGKSVMAFQLGMHWAAGLECLGMKPQRPFRILNIQCEDSELDMALERDGAIVNFSPQELELARANFRVVRLRGYSGLRFLSVLSEYCRRFHPDIIFINPLLKYFGADPNDNEEVNEFLNELEPMLQANNCGMVFIAHPKKPNRLNPTDPQYSLYGNAAWSNAVRETIELTATNTDGVYMLKSGKRFDKLGWKEKYIRRSQDKTHPRWIELDKEEIPDVMATNMESEKKHKTKELILSLVPESPAFTTREQLSSASKMSLNTIDGYLNSLVDEGKINKELVGKMKHFTRPSPMALIEKDKNEF